MTGGIDATRAITDAAGAASASTISYISISVAAISAFISGLTFIHSRNVEKRRSAELITCWIEKTQDRDICVFLNASSLPVYSVKVEVVTKEAVRRLGVLEKPMKTCRAEIEVLQPGRCEKTLFGDIPHSPRMSLSFRDAQGVKWVRYPGGKLGRAY